MKKIVGVVLPLTLVSVALVGAGTAGAADSPAAPSPALSRAAAPAAKGYGCEGIHYGISGFGPVRNSKKKVVGYNVRYGVSEECAGLPVAMIGTLSIYNQTTRKVVDASSDGGEDKVDALSVAADLPIGPHYQARFGLTMDIQEPDYRWLSAPAGCVGVDTPILHCSWTQPFSL